MDLSVVNHEDYFAKIGDDHKFPIKKFGELANYLINKKIVKRFHKPYPCSDKTLKRVHSEKYINDVKNKTLDISVVKKIGFPMILRNGFALGGGCEIAISCHIRYASENALFAQPEVKLGIIPGWGGTQRLPRIVGKGNATELIIGGHMINSQEALRIGLVNKIISPEKLMDESINFCKELQKNGPTSISNSLKCINDSYDYSLEDGLEIELEAFSNSFGSKEADEGLLAFVDKRKPKFKL